MRILQAGITKSPGNAVRRRLTIWGLLLTATAVLTVAGMGGGAALAADAQHGISFTMGCASPTAFGQPYTCTYSIRNINDDPHDTLTMHGFRSAGRNAKEAKSPTQVEGWLRTSSGSANRRRRATPRQCDTPEAIALGQRSSKTDATTSWVDPGNRALTRENPGEGT
jgi:hypothetical protein